MACQAPRPPGAPPVSRALEGRETVAWVVPRTMLALLQHSQRARAYAPTPAHECALSVVGLNYET